MPKLLNDVLTPDCVLSARPGRYVDGRGLHLLVRKTGARSWVYRYMRNGKSRDLGLGPAGSGGISLADARRKRDTLRLRNELHDDPAHIAKGNPDRAGSQA